MGQWIPMDSPHGGAWWAQVGQWIHTLTAVPTGSIMFICGMGVLRVGHSSMEFGGCI